MSAINWDNQLVINYSLETIATNLKSERLKRKCIGFQKLPRRLVNNRDFKIQQRGLRQIYRSRVGPCRGRRVRGGKFKVKMAGFNDAATRG